MIEFRRDSVRWYNWFTPPAKWIKQNAPIIHRKIQSHPFAFKETTKQWSRCWICLLLMKIIAFSIVSTLKERCDFFCFCELAGLFSSSITAQNLSIERGPEGNWVWLPPHCHHPQGARSWCWQPSMLHTSVQTHGNNPQVINTFFQRHMPKH